MEIATQERAAGVRIGAGSVPVKDRFKQNGRAERQSSRDVKSKKSTTSAGALRRSEQKDEGGATKCQRSKLGRLFRRRVGGFSVSIEPLARGFGHPVAQYVTELGAIRFALLA